MSGPLKIGISGPFSGPRRRYGDLLRECVERSGLAEQAELVFADDKAELDTALRVAERFSLQRVSVVLGHFNSACALAVRPVYQAQGIGFIAPASSHPDLGKAAPPGLAIFCPSQQQQASELLVPASAGKTLVVHDGLLYGKSLAHSTLHCLRALEREATLHLFSEPLANTLALCQRADSVIYCGAHFRAAQLFNALQQQAYTGTLLACDDCSIEHFVELLDAPYPACRVVALPGGYRAATDRALAYLRELITHFRTEALFQALGKNWQSYRFNAERRCACTHWQLLTLAELTGEGAGENSRELVCQ